MATAIWTDVLCVLRDGRAPPLSKRPAQRVVQADAQAGSHLGGDVYSHVVADLCLRLSQHVAQC